MTFGEILAYIVYLILFSAILFLVYVTTKFISYKANQAMQGKYIKVIETICLGADKRIHLLKVGKEYMLFSSTAKTLDFLTNVNLNETELNKETEDKKLQKTVFGFLTKNMNPGNLERVNYSDYIKPLKSGIFKANLERLRSIAVKNVLNEDETTNDKEDKPY